MMNNPKVGVAMVTCLLNFGTPPSITFQRIKLETSIMSGDTEALVAAQVD